MTFPKRWMDDEAPRSPMRDVLRAGGDMDPPEGAENAVWLALAAKIGTAGVAAGASAKAAAALSAKSGVTTATAAAGAGTATGAVVGAGLFKAIVIGALSGVVAVTGFSVLEPGRDGGSAPPAPVAPQVAPAPTKDRAEIAAPRGPARDAATAQPGSPEPPSQPSAGLSASTDAPAPTASAATSAAAPPPNMDVPGANPTASPDGPAGAGAGAESPATGSAEDRERMLREEREMLNQARTALRGGDTGGAMRLLEQARQKFPNGALGQEREALAIETLAKSGARDAASARAAAFIKAHPTSPHAARLQVFVLPQ